MDEKIQTLEDLERAVERIGFLPYSGNRRELLFTLEERTDNAWHDDSPSDPWLWRSQVAAGGRPGIRQVLPEAQRLCRAALPARLCRP